MSKRLGPKLFFLFPFLLSCGSQQSVPEASLPEVKDIAQTISETRKLGPSERQSKAFTLYKDLIRDAYFKPMGTPGFSEGIAKTRYASVEKEPSLSHAVAMTKPIKGQDYLGAIDPSVKTRESLLSYLTQKGYEAKDELNLGLILDVYPTFSIFAADWGDNNGMAFYRTANRGLFRFGLDGEAIPDLAESVSRGEDKLTYTINLGDHYWKDSAGADLRKIVAADFEDTYKTFWPKYEAVSYDTHIKSFKAIDEKTIEVVAEFEDSLFLKEFDSIFNYPAPKDYMENLPEYGSTPESTVFSGDYAISYDGIKTIGMTASKEGIMPKITFTIGSTGTLSDFETGKTDYIWGSFQGEEAIPATRSLTHCLFFDWRKIDSEHRKGLLNPYFRYALLSLFPRDRINAYFGYADNRLKPTWLPSNHRPDPSPEPEDFQLDESIPYAIACFKKAQEQLGSEFFSSPISIVVQTLGRDGFDAEVKRRAQEIFGNYISMSVTHPSSDFVESTSAGLIRIEYFDRSRIDLLESLSHYERQGFGLYQI